MLNGNLHKLDTVINSDKNREKRKETFRVIFILNE